MGGREGVGSTGPRPGAGRGGSGARRGALDGIGQLARVEVAYGAVVCGDGVPRLELQHAVELCGRDVEGALGHAEETSVEADGGACVGVHHEALEAREGILGPLEVAHLQLQPPQHREKLPAGRERRPRRRRRRRQQVGTARIDELLEVEERERVVARRAARVGEGQHHLRSRGDERGESGAVAAAVGCGRPTEASGAAECGARTCCCWSRRSGLAGSSASIRAWTVVSSA